jgi:hypothetical protein
MIEFIAVIDFNYTELPERRAMNSAAARYSTGMGCGLSSANLGTAEL